jgi:MarR family 2-MHQ and catechol resistance regulon transcriptional repressor
VKLQDELGLRAPFQDLRHETVLNIVRTATVLSGKASQLFRAYGLTEAQFNVLFALKFANGNITQAELGKRLVVTRASITSVLDKLESKGWVKRVDVPENRRIHHVILTETGRGLVNEVEPAYRREVHGVLRDLDDDQCRTLMRLLETVRGSVRAGPAPAGDSSRPGQ